MIIHCKYDFNHKSNGKYLSIFHLNIALLSAHKDELETVLKILNYNIDIISITETKIIKNNSPAFDISLQGYKQYYTPTESKKRRNNIADHYNYKPKQARSNKRAATHATLLECVCVSRH